MRQFLGGSTPPSRLSSHQYYEVRKGVPDRYQSDLTFKCCPALQQLCNLGRNQSVYACQEQVQEQESCVREQASQGEPARRVLRHLGVPGQGSIFQIGLRIDKYCMGRKHNKNEQIKILKRIGRSFQEFQHQHIQTLIFFSFASFSALLSFLDFLQLSKLLELFQNFFNILRLFRLSSFGLFTIYFSCLPFCDLSILYSAEPIRSPAQDTRQTPDHRAISLRPFLPQERLQDHDFNRFGLRIFSALDHIFFKIVNLVISYHCNRFRVSGRSRRGSRNQLIIGFLLVIRRV